MFNRTDKETTTMTYQPGDRVLYNFEDPATVTKTFPSGTLVIERDARDDKSIAWRSLYVTPDTLTPIPAETATWNGYKTRSRVALVEILRTAVYLLDAADGECDDEVELSADDADELLGDLSTAWTAIHPTSPGLVDVAMSVWQKQVTLDDAIGF